MHITQKIEVLFRLGQILKAIADKQDYPGYDLGINESEYNEFKTLTQSLKQFNQWFTETEVLRALGGISTWLTKENLENYSNDLKQEGKTKTVALILAGNIPLVGFHDFLTVYLSKHKAVIKLSSEDDKLLPAVLHLMSYFDEEIKSRIQFTREKLGDFDAVIATGSNNTANYFQTYFGKYPHIIRKNRTSVAILKGDETKEELENLGKDIFNFFGLGCRNVTKIFIPDDFELNRFFEAIFSFGDVVYHHKYANNYDYNKAVYMMNQIPILDNNFLVLKEDEALHSPLGVLFYERYAQESELNEKLNGMAEDLQVIIGKEWTDFGKAQTPSLFDFADNIDTRLFLNSLG